MKMYIMQKVPCHNFVSRSLRELMLGQSSRVFLARLEGTDRHGESLEHVVTIDSRTKLVNDPAEQYALYDRDNVFDLCVGDGFELTSVVEVRKLGRQETGKKSRKKRPMGTEKKQAVRKKKRLQKKNKIRRKRVVIETDCDE